MNTNTIMTDKDWEKLNNTLDGKRSKLAKFVNDHKKELIIGGIVMTGSVIIVTKAFNATYKAGFAKGVASIKFADDAECALHVCPKLWVKPDGSSVLTAALTQVGPTIAGGMAENTVALPKAEAMDMVAKIMEIFKEA